MPTATKPTKNQIRRAKKKAAKYNEVCRLHIKKYDLLISYLRQIPYKLQSLSVNRNRLHP